MKHSSSRSSVDLLGAPVPSAIPSPDLHPIAKQLDLMKFENIAGIWAQINFLLGVNTISIFKSLNCSLTLQFQDNI